MHHDVEALNQPYHFIMDNAPYHNSAHVAARFAEHEPSLVQLPPYSPMLNSTEMAFSKWKRAISAKTQSELKKIIHGAAQPDNQSLLQTATDQSHSIICNFAHTAIFLVLCTESQIRPAT